MVGFCRKNYESVGSGKWKYPERLKMYFDFLMISTIEWDSVYIMGWKN